MKTLEEHAEEFSKKRIELDLGYSKGLYYGFIGCSKSKWFEAEKIKAQIEVLKRCTIVPRFEWEFCRIGKKIIELEQKLEQLENE